MAAIGPPGDPRAKFGPVVVPPQFAGPHPTSRGASQLMPGSPEAREMERTRAAEKEASNRIKMAEERTADVERTSEQQIHEVRDEYDKRNAQESARQEGAIQDQKAKGYAAIRDLQRAQQAEVNRVRREGERDLARTQAHFSDAVHTAVHTGDEELTQLRDRTAREQEYTKKSTEQDTEATKAENTRRLQELQAHQEDRMGAISKSANADYEKIRGTSELARQEADAKFQHQYQSTTQQQNETLDRLNVRTTGNIREIRQDTAQKLAAYENRQADPFYKLTTVDADLSETSDAFILRAEIPRHEQGHVSVSIRGNQVVLSGYRRNQEKIDLSPGRTQSSAAFQSYSESFPLDWPVEARQLSREFSGDTLTVTIPKKSLTDAPPTYKAKRPVARARVEMPQFPQNLPPAEAGPPDLAWPDELTAEGDPLPQKRGQGTKPLA